MRGPDLAVWRGAGSAERASAAGRLRALLQAAQAERRCLQAPGCYDAMSGKAAALAGFPLGFMSGFGVAAARGMPDTGLLTMTEMVDAARAIVDCVPGVEVPLVADGDTGFGNAVNVKRTVRAMARAGAAAIMIEDQVMPKRCGYAGGDKGVIPRQEALARMQAAVDARDEGADILIVARTDARGAFGIDEAIERCRLFRELGADITHLSGPKSREEMVEYCKRVSGPKMANCNSASSNFRLPLEDLAAIGYTFAVYPDLLLGSAMNGHRRALQDLRGGVYPSQAMQDFEQTKRDCSFPAYDAEAKRYPENVGARL